MSDDYDPRVDMRRSDASVRWATLGLCMLGIIVMGLVWLFVETYYGADGVRVVGVVVGIGILVLMIIGVGYGVNAIATGLATRHHENILRGLVAFQREDDRGEVARTVANGVAGVLRSGNQLDRTTLQVAGRLAQQQTQALIAAQRRDDKQQATDAEVGWWNVPATFEDDQTPKEW
jgi:hypothetical protein